MWHAAFFKDLIMLRLKHSGRTDETFWPGIGSFQPSRPFPDLAARSPTWPPVPRPGRPFPDPGARPSEGPPGGGDGVLVNIIKVLVWVVSSISRIQGLIEVQL